MFGLNEKLPRRVDVVVDNMGQATWEHSLQSVRAGGTVVTVGVTTGNDPSANLLRLVSEKITVMGSIMGTLEEMHNMIRLVIDGGDWARDWRGDAPGGGQGGDPHPRQRARTIAIDRGLPWAIPCSRND